MIGQVKVISVNGNDYTISDKLYDLLLGDAEIEREVSNIIARCNSVARPKKSGGKKK